MCKNSNTRARTCMHFDFLIYQVIDMYISYLCCEYQLNWTLNGWFRGVLVLANQIQAHVHARAEMHFSVHRSIDVYIIYLCCEYQLIWSYNELSIGFLVLANQNQAHAHARADGQFLPHRSINCVNLYLRHKYQANPLKNNDVIVQWNLLKYKTFARAHVHARVGRKFWPCRSVRDINIYLPYKFEWIWTKNKKVSFARFYVQKFKRTCTRVHAFSEKMTIVRTIYKW